MRVTKAQVMAGVNDTVVAAKLVGTATVAYTTAAGNEVIRYHRTDVITRKPNGDVTLNTDGYESVTTKKRINDNAGGKFRVFQKAYKWFLETECGTEAVEFRDGMTVHPNGSVSYE